MDPQPRNLAQLATALESAWLNIPENTFRDLSDSLPARLAAVRSAKATSLSRGPTVFAKPAVDEFNSVLFLAPAGMAYFVYAFFSEGIDPSDTLLLGIFYVFLTRNLAEQTLGAIF
ncbi:transposable element Tcb1 transposase [Trichonephila clavipes]|nr:transposable element Tcb1 transposase [Trichonephila clavipes]